MKLLKTIFVIAIGLLIFSSVSAQDTEFTDYRNETFGVMGIVPSDWQSAGAGIFARGATAGDATVLVMQSAPVDTDTLLGSLAPQLGIEAFPESEGEIETNFSTWTMYTVEVNVAPITVVVAVTNLDDMTYLVMLQTTNEEHDTLREEVFLPVLESVEPLVMSDDEMSEDVPYTIEDVTFDSGDITLAGTLTIPEGDGDFPVVVLVSGSGASDRDESLAPIADIKPFHDIADHLSRNGIAVLRYDDRGVGESEGNFVEADLYDFRDDASAAIDYLASRDQFSSIGIAGHSEGGVFAPEVAINNDNVAFYIGLAAPTVRVIDILREQNQLLFAAAGIEADQLAEIDQAYIDVIDALETDADEATLRQAVAQLVTAQSGTEQSDAVIDQGLAQFQSPILQSYVTYNPTPFWLELDVPTLAIFGSLDLQVSPDQVIPVIDEQNDNITIVTIDSMNHIFQLAETGALSEYGSLEQTVMPELLDTMTDWILEITAQ